MVIFLLLNLLIADFQERWVIPYGTIASGGRLLIYDSDHDGEIELIFRRWIVGSVGVYFVEFVPPDSWDIYESTTVDSVLVWDVGDLDIDGYTDLITDGNASWPPPVPIISVYESADSFSYPSSEVWRDTVDIGTVQPICAYDIDRDSVPEIVQTGGEVGTNYYIDFSIYESNGNNNYSVTYQYESPETPTSTVAFGDFDQDSLNEFVMGTIDGQYSIFESSANNTYVPLHENIQLTTRNIKDCFAVPDADGDNKLEFVIKGYVIPTSQIDAFIFESIGDDIYEIVDTLVFPGGDYYGGYSAAGDVDGDSVPEIVLEARQNVFIIKASGNDSFYVWDTLPGHANGSSVAIYDIDGNGYQEIVISGNDETRIYEYDVGIEEYTSSHNEEHKHFATIFRGSLLLPVGENYRVFDITGRVVMSDKIKPGIYFIEVDGKITQKVIKIK